MSVRRLLHVSDIHFGPKHLRDRSEALLGLIEERRPDNVVVSGDLTQRAKPRQFREAREFVDRIPAPVLAVPGNHDVPLYRVWERVLVPLRAYRRHFSEDLEPVLEDEKLLIVGVNTAHNWTLTGGRVGRRQLERLRRVFGSAAPGQCRIAVLHHHIVPAPDGRAPGVLRGAARTLHALRDVGVELVLSGHLHRSFLARSSSDSDAGLGMTILHAGTTTSSRGREAETGENTCNWLEIDGDSLQLESLWWTDEGGGGFEVRHRHSLPRRPTSAAPVVLEA